MIIFGTTIPFISAHPSAYRNTQTFYPGILEPMVFSKTEISNKKTGVPPVWQYPIAVKSNLTP
jgi:hypothetical protein